MTDPTGYARLEQASAPAFSIDGRTLFHLRGAGLQQVWALDLEAGTSRPLTHHDERVGALRRAPNDDRLLYTLDAGGDERHQIWLLEDGVSRPLTASQHVAHGLGAWSPDGTRISLTANDRDEAHFDALTLDLSTGATTRLLEGTHEATLGAWGADGRMVMVQDRATPDQRPILIAADGHATPLPRKGPTRFANLRWDKDTLLGLSDASTHEFVALCRIDPDTGAATPVFAPESRDVDAFALSTAGLLATVENDRGHALLRVGPVGGDRPIVDGLPQGVVSDLAWSVDGTTLAFALATPTSPASLHLWHDGATRPVFTPECSLPLQPFERVEWPTFDGRTIPGWLALPQGTAPAAGWPAVIWVHGGPAAQARPNFRPDMQALLAQGYAVLMPNVRGSTGYGAASTASDDVDRRLDAVHDLAAGHTWLAAQDAIDASRIAVMGQSYGGYMVLAAITEYPALWRCAIDLYGIADFGTLLEATGPWRRAHRAAEYGDPARHRALFDRISPLRHARRITAPLLVLHGTRDPRVAINESEQMVSALRSLGRPVDYEVFDYAGHGFVRPGDKDRVYGAVAAFLERHL